MNDQETALPPKTETSADFSLVYRAILKKAYIDTETREIDPQAFMCRPRNDFKGLSVGFATQHLDHLKVSGIAELDVTGIYSLSLTIQKTSSIHANIVGVPRKAEIRVEDEKSENFQEYKDILHYDTEQAEYLAGKLAKLARLLDFRLMS